MNLMPPGEAIAKTSRLVFSYPSILKIRSMGKFRSVMFAFAFAALLLANVVSGNSLGLVAEAQAVDSSIDYPENGRRPVGIFYAYDQDGDSIEWSLSGPDAGLFTIDGGVLAFRELPNYEDPQSASSGSIEARNVYRVTIEASGGTHDVTVTVIDVDETGTVRLDRPQPQVGRPLGAIFSDEDTGATAQRWQWATSEDGVAWSDIEGATPAKRSPAPEDEGMYLRATVTYSDRFGSGKTASAVSAHRLEARTLSNAAPSFVEQDENEDTGYVDVTRSVPENTVVGRPIGGAVSATDTDEDALFYELLETPDLLDDDDRALFSIDSLSGQIRVGKALGADPGETEDEDSMDLTAVLGLTTDEDPGKAANSEYVLRVKVSDPSTASATVNVIVVVTNVNEAPQFRKDAPTELSVAEGDADKILKAGTPPVELQGSTYAVTDEDAEDSPSQTGAYSLEGADKDSFRISDDGLLSVAASHTPDYEKQSSYSITIVARSGEGPRSMAATLDVTVEVEDGEDPGEVTLSQREPREGVEVYATVTDPDGGVTIASWGWERSEETDTCLGAVNWRPIGRSSSAVYIPSPADLGSCLRAVAMYRDNIGDELERAEAALEVPVRRQGPPGVPEQEAGFVNAAPEFPDQDPLTEGIQSDRTTRTVAENTRAGTNIGPPVSAKDDDGALLIYTLGAPTLDPSAW